jgi:hypothetical protein
LKMNRSGVRNGHLITESGSETTVDKTKIVTGGIITL